jgi:hypothetical protein
MQSAEFLTLMEATTPPLRAIFFSKKSTPRVCGVRWSVCGGGV